MIVDLRSGNERTVSIVVSSRSYGGLRVAFEAVMRNRREVLASERIPKAYADVRAEWLADPLGILQHATTTSLSGLFGAKLRVPVGPVEVASEIVVDIVGIEECRSPSHEPATKLMIEWCAMRSPDLFPTMHATMTIYPLTRTETALEFRGAYELPFGLAGRAADAIAIHRIAKESVTHFLADIAHLLRQPISNGTAA